MKAKEDYERLLTAAKLIKKWESPAEIARQLTLHGHKTTDQIMTNWRQRGISAKGRLACAHIIGCRPYWLETGSGEMTEGVSTYVRPDFEQANPHAAQEPHPLFAKLDKLQPDQLDKVLALINAAEAMADNKQFATSLAPQALPDTAETESIDSHAESLMQIMLQIPESIRGDIYAKAIKRLNADLDKYKMEGWGYLDKKKIASP